MYTVALRREFIAQHFLIGGDWGLENEKHLHHYRVEVQLEGRTLGEHGYMMDIVDIETAVKALVDRYQGQTLNELPEFEGLNPSIEHFSRIFCQKFSHRIRAPNVAGVTVRIWEDNDAWASYRQEL